MNLYISTVCNGCIGLAHINNDSGVACSYDQ